MPLPKKLTVAHPIILVSVLILELTYGESLSHRTLVVLNRPPADSHNAKRQKRQTRPNARRQPEACEQRRAQISNTNSGYPVVHRKCDDDGPSIAPPG